MQIDHNFLPPHNLEFALPCQSQDKSEIPQLMPASLMELHPA
jgi:hypothetical protein